MKRIRQNLCEVFCLHKLLCLYDVMYPYDALCLHEAVGLRHIGQFRFAVVFFVPIVAGRLKSVCFLMRFADGLMC